MNRFIHWYCTLCCVSSLLVLGLILVFAIPGWGQPAHTGKKVISFSGRPTARMFFDDVREMERVMPVVDGVTIYPITEKYGLRTEAVGRLFRKDFHRLVDLDTGIELMRSADMNLYMENFLLVYLDPGIAGLKVPNWFDSEFDAVVNNWKVAAEYCKRAGMVGFLFDNEAYNATNLWDSQRVNHLDPRTIEAYHDKVFERGAEIMRAVSSVYPDIRIITLLGPVHSNIGGGGRRATTSISRARSSTGCCRNALAKP